MDSPYAILVQILAVSLWIFTIRQSLDEWLATPLTEEVEVQEKRFLPAHPGNGKWRGAQQKTWILRGANANGDGWVKVTQQDYDSIKIGDKLFVSGKKGRLTRHWYLGSAHKK